ncbi:MAG: hypothetical protein PHT58_02325 [Eubacteriales bacterium]|nr:hypothetical protein [Eubacteriales bacterium]
MASDKGKRIRIIALLMAVVLLLILSLSVVPPLAHDVAHCHHAGCCICAVVRTAQRFFELPAICVFLALFIAWGVFVKINPSNNNPSFFRTPILSKTRMND